VAGRVERLQVGPEDPIGGGVAVEFRFCGRAEFRGEIDVARGYLETVDAGRVAHFKDDIDELALEESCALGENDPEVGRLRECSGRESEDAVSEHESTW